MHNIQDTNTSTTYTMKYVSAIHSFSWTMIILDLIGYQCLHNSHGIFHDHAMQKLFLEPFQVRAAKPKETLGKEKGRVGWTHAGFLHARRVKIAVARMFNVHNEGRTNCRLLHVSRITHTRTLCYYFSLSGILAMEGERDTRILSFFFSLPCSPSVGPSASYLHQTSWESKQQGEEGERKSRERERERESGELLLLLLHSHGSGANVVSSLRPATELGASAYRNRTAITKKHHLRLLVKRTREYFFTSVTQPAIYQRLSSIDISWSGKG